MYFTLNKKERKKFMQFWVAVSVIVVVKINKKKANEMKRK